MMVVVDGRRVARENLGERSKSGGKGGACGPVKMGLFVL